MKPGDFVKFKDGNRQVFGEVVSIRNVQGSCFFITVKESPDSRPNGHLVDWKKIKVQN